MPVNGESPSIIIVPSGASRGSSPPTSTNIATYPQHCAATAPAADSVEIRGKKRLKKGLLAMLGAAIAGRGVLLLAMTKRIPRNLVFPSALGLGALQVGGIVATALGLNDLLSTKDSEKQNH